MRTPKDGSIVEFTRKRIANARHPVYGIRIDGQKVRHLAISQTVLHLGKTSLILAGVLTGEGAARTEYFEVLTVNADDPTIFDHAKKHARIIDALKDYFDQLGEEAAADLRRAFTEAPPETNGQRD